MKSNEEAAIKEWPLDVICEGNEVLNADIQRCRMIVSLLRDYEIRHIVVSSGARDVSLARFFEANEFFITHNVVDERSAAYYALGIAQQTGESVGMICTSGTAVSNYLPGITEAYHMRIPIVAITGDRYPQYMGQMEAQKTDHIGALRSVVKMSVDLYSDWSELTQWDTRRRVSEALLEMTHHGCGPVHINVPMNYLQNEYPTKDELNLGIYPHISRVELSFSNDVWDKFRKKLKKKNRILLVAGQSSRMKEEEQEVFDAFCEQYNVAVVVDHLSNLSNNYTVYSHDILRRMKNCEFNELLCPDLVIWIGGKRVLNDPIIGKIRNAPHIFEFWRIADDGEIADLCYKLSHVFEMPQKVFFERMIEKGNKGRNDGEYLNLWKNEYSKVEHFDYENSRTFSAYHTIGKLMDKIPPKSELHLGIGTSFDRAHYFMKDPSIDVFCNMGTNGIDGSASTYMGQVSVTDRLIFLVIGDLSFFYDMNSVWSKELKGNIRILLNNDGQAGYIKHFNTKGITHSHNTSAKGWVESLGFEYLSASTKEEYAYCLKRFVSEVDAPMFLEAFLN